MEDTKPRSRRRHGNDLKRIVLDECNQPGASVARVALSHGLNANLVHKWRREVQRAVPAPASSRAFIPLAIAPVSPASEVRIELRRGPISVTVNWPMSAMPECAGWLRELLR